MRASQLIGVVVAALASIVYGYIPLEVTLQRYRGPIIKARVTNRSRRPINVLKKGSILDPSALNHKVDATAAGVPLSTSS